jgi:hypothetical protein
MTILRVVSTVGIIAALGAVHACTEPAANRAVVTPEKTMEARLILSDSAPAVGRTVDVFAQVNATASEMVGSYTARIRYDTTALRYEEEIAIADDALRATNAASGLLRFAGASPKGLSSGRMAGYRFVVLRANATQSLQLVIDEMHTAARTNVSAQLRSAAP